MQKLDKDFSFCEFPSNMSTEFDLLAAESFLLDANGDSIIDVESLFNTDVFFDISDDSAHGSPLVPQATTPTPMPAENVPDILSTPSIAELSININHAMPNSESPIHSQPSTAVSPRGKAAARKRARNVQQEDSPSDELAGQNGQSEPRSRMRENESRYRRGMQQLFDALGQVLNAPGAPRTKLLESALSRLQQAASEKPVVLSSSPPPPVQQQPLPVDHRVLFLTDSIPMAVLGLDGRYLDVNLALQTACNRTSEELARITLFSKARDEVSRARYQNAFAALLSNPSGGDQAVPLPCPEMQAAYAANGYMLLMVFSVVLHALEPRPLYIRMRIAPVSMSSDEMRRLLPEAAIVEWSCFTRCLSNCFYVIYTHVYIIFFVCLC